MASSRNILRCERILERSRHAWQPLRHTASQRRSLYSHTPLYLDFLAPSWRQPEATMRRTLPLSSDRPRSLCQRKTFSTAVTRQAQAIQNPRKDDSGDEMIINISPRASHRLRAIAQKDENPDLALRVSVESGGCHGFQYLMSLVNLSDVDAAEDTVFENEQEGSGYKPKVVMDEPSLELLKGSTIDYTMELIGSQFKVTGIPGAKSSCGCGTSFDIA
ncbi:hypothetical protein BAUCODRAFT_77285 [Baudoinia panamericana UAMH 10762]|uniref:Core domain-containing protein n=1 Tax=Baudoinia panamericana (strain UAMH 10762) TaxID=717646 RepID=M2LF96_BAUPA|nr:uncharacterized protein BAUCODRAFT_77285 [Baudoinia panamericana UAMH 10762]EMC92707.1 hypothetical protein BAUCODRAFT_77285 [Baudoinia panamericana UAMH 10762]